MTKHIMLDLEALDPKIGGVLVSVGAVYFDLDTGELSDEFYCELSKYAIEEQCQVYNRTISINCLQWWMQQSTKARDVFKKKDNQEHSFRQALINFQRFVRDDKIRIWGNGADFDNVFLADCFKAAKIGLPWSGRYNRCYRTVKSMFGHKAKLVRVGAHHNALDDAKTQALHLIAMLKDMRVNE